MQTRTNDYIAAMASPVREVKAKVLSYSGSTLVNTFTESDAIQDIEIQRIGEDNKFFGFGICQKIQLKLVNSASIQVSTTNRLVPSIGIKLGNNTVEYKAFPSFYVEEVTRDENNSNLNITAYDLLYKATSHTAIELSVTLPATIKDYADACAALLGTTAAGTSIAAFSTSYAEGANLNGDETLRQVLDMIAEATQTIYYVGYDNIIHFIRLDKTGSALLSIDKSKYYTADSSGIKSLQTIASITQLGDNISASTANAGSTQYCRDNAFWENRTDTATLLDAAITAVGDSQICQFNCSWRGDMATEIGDKITITTKDNSTITTYILNDTITYNGGLKQKTSWAYTDEEATATNPTSLGEVLNKTFARVDKVNKQIDIVAGEVTDTKNNVAQLTLDTQSIQAQVNSLNTSVAAKMSAEDVQIQINSTLAEGVNKVTTTTGFVFDDSGLNISKTGSATSTLIDDNGMRVSESGNTVLTANNAGVDAKNLHCTTYLIIGNNSRIEDFGYKSACFWIGG